MANSEAKSRFRFRLRTLVILVTLIAAGFGGYRAFVTPYLLQNEIRLAIEEAGGLYEMRPAPEWVRFLCGDQNVCVLTKVDLEFEPYETERPQALLEQIKHLTELEDLNLAWQDVTDDIVASWKGLRKIKTLNLGFTLVQDPSRWPQFPLSSLNLEGTFIRSEHAGALTQYPHLKSLILDRTPLTDAGLARLRSLAKLEDLRLEYTGVTTESRDTLKSFPRLDRVNVGTIVVQPWRDEESSFLLTNPETVGDGVEIEVNAAAKDAARLSLQERVENMSGDEVVVFFFEGFHLDLLVGNEDIQELYFEEEAFLRLEDLRVLPTLPNLRQVTMRGAILDEEAWSIIAECPKLWWLDVASSSLTDEGLRRVLKCSSLGHLDLSGTHITDRGLAYLAERPELKGISIHGTPITSEGLHHLQPLQDLEWLSLPLLHGLGLRDLTKLASLSEVNFSTGANSPVWRQLAHDAEPTLTVEDIGDFAVLAKMKADRAQDRDKKATTNYWAWRAEGIPFPGHEQAELIILLLPFQLTEEALKSLPDGGVAWKTIRTRDPVYNGW